MISGKSQLLAGYARPAVWPPSSCLITESLKLFTPASMPHSSKPPAFPHALLNTWNAFCTFTACLEYLFCWKACLTLQAETSTPSSGVVELPVYLSHSDNTESSTEHALVLWPRVFATGPLHSQVLIPDKYQCLWGPSLQIQPGPETHRLSPVLTQSELRMFTA